MFDRIFELQVGVSYINNRLFDLLDEVVKEHEKEIIQIYQDNQLSQGLDQYGEDVGVYTSNWYAKVWKPDIRPDWKGVFDLKLTGNLYAGQIIENEGEYYQIVAPGVDYFQDLCSRYGVKWLGLMNDTRYLLVQKIIWPNLIKKMREILSI